MEYVLKKNAELYQKLA